MQMFHFANRVSGFVIVDSEDMVLFKSCEKMDEVSRNWKCLIFFKHLKTLILQTLTNIEVMSSLKALIASTRYLENTIFLFQGRQKIKPNRMCSTSQKLHQFSQSD